MNRAVLLLALVVAACGDDGSTNRLPTANPLTLTTPEDVAVTGAVEASDPDGDALTATLAASPAHGTATVSGLGVTFTPEANYHGDDQFALAITDGRQTTTLTINVTVTPVNDPPVGTADSIQTSEDTPRVVPVDQLLANDTDVDTDTLAITAVTAGAHGSVTLADGNVTYVPAANFVGGDMFTYTINDGTVDATVEVAVVVGGVNDAPVAVDDVVTTAEDTAITIQGTTLLANDSDADGDTLTISAVGSATGGTVVLNGGNPIFTPTANSTTAGSFVYTVTDGVSTDTATVTVNITAANDGPVAVDDTATTDEDVVATINVLANDSDPDGTTPTLVGVSNAQGGTPVANTANGTVAFTPNANFHGTATFDYTITDGTLTDTATVTVTVNAVNDPVVAVDDAGSTPQNTPITFANLTANDLDPDVATDGQTLTVTAVGNAVNGTVVLSNGEAVFTPSSNQAGSFEYTVSDGNGSTDVGLVTVTVSAPNVVPPTADPDSVSQIDAATAYPHAVFLANDSDGGDGDVLTIVSVSNAVNGTVTLEANTITFTPTANFEGTASFQYELSDGLATTSTTTVTVAVSDCGNGQISGPETCDDGGNAVGDGCSATCTVEPGFTCNNQNPPSVCTPAVLASFSFTGGAGTEVTATADVANGITAPVIRRGSGVSPAAGANAFSASGWTTTSPAVIDPNDFFTFTVNPNANGTLSLTQLKFDERRSGTGIRQFVVRSSVDGFTADLLAVTVPDDDLTRTHTITLPAAFLGVGAPIEFRIFGFGAEAGGGTWRLDNIILTGSATP